MRLSLILIFTLHHFRPTVQSSIAQYMADNINQYIHHLKPDYARKLIKGHLVAIGLISNHEKWAHPKLSGAVGHFLLPTKVTRQDFSSLVEEMSVNIAKNPYLSEAIEELKQREYPKLQHKLATEGAVVIPDALALAWVIERLTVAITKDWTVFKVCHDVWKRHNNVQKIFHAFEPDRQVFGTAKVLSLIQVFDRALGMLEAQQVDPTFGNNELVLNILEAVREDERVGFTDNASVGETLAKIPCGQPVFDNRTGAGPSGLWHDRQQVVCRLPLGVQWADLYTTWVLAFTSQADDFPYFLVPLLVPSVNGYQDHPELFFHHRAVALAPFVSFSINRPNRKSKDLDWSDPNFTRDWGRVNKVSMEDYIGQYASATGGKFGALKRRPLPNFWISVKRFVCKSVWYACGRAFDKLPVPKR